MRGYTHASTDRCSTTHTCTLFDTLRAHTTVVAWNVSHTLHSPPSSARRSRRSTRAPYPSIHIGIRTEKTRTHVCLRNTCAYTRTTHTHRPLSAHTRERRSSTSQHIALVTQPCVVWGFAPHAHTEAAHLHVCTRTSIYLRREMHNRGGV